MCKVCDFANAVCDGRRVAKSCAKSQIAGKSARLEHFAAKSTSLSAALIVPVLKEHINCREAIMAYCLGSSLSSTISYYGSA